MPTNGLFAAIVLALLQFMRPVLAEQPAARGLSQQEQLRLGELASKASSAGPGSLSAGQLIDLYELQAKDRPVGGSEIWESFRDELVRWWAVDRGLEADAAVAQLSRATVEKYETTDKAVQQRLRRQLSDLPAPGGNAYNPPSYIPRGPVLRVRRPSVVGKPPFGPNVKSGITRLSNGVVPRP